MTVWDEVVGQDAAVATLQHAASTPQAMTHAWLFTGPPGSGRSVAARAFAAALECERPAGGAAAGVEGGAESAAGIAAPGCGQCQQCRMVMAGTHPDVTLVATDKVIISIDEVRGLIASAARTPSSGRYRIIVVEDADRMVEKTTNVLLKSIEEPPAHTVWILCAPTAGDVLPTIRSRCRPVVLRVPAPQAVADLIVRRDGVDAAVALAAAQAAQSHVGLARRLARDPDARRRRADILALPLQVRGVGDAVIAADRLVSIAKKESESATVERDTEEKAQLLRALGVEPGASVPPRLRSQVKNLEDDQKRRATRRQRDMLDRAMLDLLSLYRDVLLIQMGAGANHPIDLVNGADPTLDRHIRALAAATTPQSTLERMDAIGQARQRVQQNVPPLLACEAMMVALR